MFNVYLPKLLEGRGTRVEADAGVAKSLSASMWDVVIYALGGCPGAVVSATYSLHSSLGSNDVLQLGAYLIEGPLGRRLSLAGSTFVTALFCVIFVLVEQSWAVRASTVGISLSATVRSPWPAARTTCLLRHVVAGHVGCSVWMDAGNLWHERLDFIIAAQ